MKRMIRDNLGPGGTLDNDRFSRALLAYRNTPDRDTNRSPAKVLFGRQIRDFIPSPIGKYQPRQEWLLKGEELTLKTKVLPPLAVGTVVSIHNQRGSHSMRWDNSGVVVESSHLI